MRAAPGKAARYTTRRARARCCTRRRRACPRRRRCRTAATPPPPAAHPARPGRRERGPAPRPAAVKPASQGGLLTVWSWVYLPFPIEGRLARGEVLVGAGGVLAGPLVELLAGAAAGAVHVQAQSAARVLELPRPVGLLDRQPVAVRGVVGDLLDDVRGASGVGAAGYRDVVAGVLGPQLAVAARGGHQLVVTSRETTTTRSLDAGLADDLLCA